MLNSFVRNALSALLVVGLGAGASYGHNPQQLKHYELVTPNATPEENAAYSQRLSALRPSMRKAVMSLLYRDLWT